jgi:nucleoside-diphosphate-sugar epimerase
MRIAILGATSQIARDLVQTLLANHGHDLTLYARRPEAVTHWMAGVGLRSQCAVADFAAFNSNQHFDVILNFVGVGNPVHAVAMGASIFDVTLQYDELALNYVREHPNCRYIFLSSGAAYGAGFDAPVDGSSTAAVPINNLKPQDWYGVAKLYAECRHRAQTTLPIVDIRVFNYFSSTQDMEARFLITDILRSIREKTVLKTSADYIVRDFIHPLDFYSLVNSILAAPATNAVLDAYSKAPIDKPTLLAAMQESFGLQYEIVAAGASVNATGGKSRYYSLNKGAAEFGYEPKLTSLEGIFHEFSKILDVSSKKYLNT